MPKMFGLHSCDNRICCNPDHLWEGTHKDNMDDMIAKGRGNLKNGGAVGEKNRHAKITRRQAEEIRQIVGMTKVEIAALYGLTPPTIGKIIHRQIWR